MRAGDSRDLEDWFADFASVSGLASVQEVEDERMDGGGAEEGVGGRKGRRRRNGTVKQRKGNIKSVSGGSSTACESWAKPGKKNVGPSASHIDSHLDKEHAQPCVESFVMA